jgi:hypothetical protein
VNPEALIAGKERFEAREDFVIVLRVLRRDEVKGYAEATRKIRGKNATLNIYAVVKVTIVSCTRRAGGNRGSITAPCKKRALRTSEVREDPRESTGTF